YGRYEKLDGSVVSGASVSDLIKQKSPVLYKQFDDALNSIETNMRVVYDAGEQANPIRFDQIIGQDENGKEKQAALAAVYELVELTSAFASVEELLSIQALTLDGSGD
ncbi:imelysin family protein, partial [Vibrio genomosp. F10 str. 9ZD137]